VAPVKLPTQVWFATTPDSTAQNDVAAELSCDQRVGILDELEPPATGISLSDPASWFLVEGGPESSLSHPGASWDLFPFYQGTHTVTHGSCFAISVEKDRDPMHILPCVSCRKGILSDDQVPRLFGAFWGGRGCGFTSRVSKAQIQVSVERLPPQAEDMQKRRIFLHP
jgi:hypothetical protein